MDITLDWLVGFIEGEGAFVRRNVNGRKVPGFNLSQKDALEELKAIQRFLGFGHINQAQKTNGKYIDVFTVRKRRECIKVMTLLDGKLRLAKRIKQFEEWKAICLNGSRHSHWLKDEEEQAKKLLSLGMKYSEVAEAVGHSEMGISLRNYMKWRIVPLARGDRTWTTADDQKAQQMLKDGLTYSQVAEAIGRSYPSVKWRNLHRWRLPYCYGDAGFPIRPEAKSSRSLIQK